MEDGLLSLCETTVRNHLVIEFFDGRGSAQLAQSHDGRPMELVILRDLNFTHSACSLYRPSKRSANQAWKPRTMSLALGGRHVSVTELYRGLVRQLYANHGFAPGLGRTFRPIA